MQDELSDGLCKLLQPYHEYAYTLKPFLGRCNKQFWTIERHGEWKKAYKDIVEKKVINEEKLKKICQTSRCNLDNDFKNIIATLAESFMSDKMFSLYRMIEADYKHLKLKFHIYDILCNKATNTKMAEWTLNLDSFYNTKTKTKDQIRMNMYSRQAYRKLFCSITYLNGQNVDWLG